MLARTDNLHNHRSLRKAEAEPRSCSNAPGLVVRLSHVCLTHFLSANGCPCSPNSSRELDSPNIRYSIRLPPPGRCLAVSTWGPESMNVRRQMAKEVAGSNVSK